MPDLRSQERRFLTIKLTELGVFLEDLYARLNRREFVHPDPLEFLYHYGNPLDREIVGFIASSLAYGRVNQILKSVKSVLEPMGKSPRLFIEKGNLDSFLSTYSGFKHRFTTDVELAQILEGIRITLVNHGSINSFFSKAYKKSGMAKAMSELTEILKCRCELPNNSMVPTPDKNSACKRLWLYLRWMVRSDEVDPGGWDDVSPSDLLVPLDTHMFSIAKQIGFCNRNQADMKSAVEITGNFRLISENDPVKYDFCLTRLGIHPDFSKKMLSF